MGVGVVPSLLDTAHARARKVDLLVHAGLRGAQDAQFTGVPRRRRRCLGVRVERVLEGAEVCAAGLEGDVEARVGGVDVVLARQGRDLRGIPLEGERG